MATTPLQQIKQEGGLSIAKLAGLLDLSLTSAQRSLGSLTEKGLISGFKTGEPGEIIQLTEKGEQLADQMHSNSQAF